MIDYLKSKWACFRHGHIYKRVSDTLGGVWIKCTRCGALEEHLPGVHEPKGYHETNR